jgi:hypothetical protein
MGAFELIGHMLQAWIPLAKGWVKQGTCKASVYLVKANKELITQDTGSQEAMFSVASSAAMIPQDPPVTVFSDHLWSNPK